MSATSPTAPQAGPGRKFNNYFDGLAVTGMHKVIFFIIMMAYFFEQMDNWNFGFIAHAIFKSWGLDEPQSNAAMSKIVFWYFIGMTSGGFLGGVISDFIGRRKTFLFSIVLFSSCSIINGLPLEHMNIPPDFILPIFIVARSLTGFGVFCLMVCSQAYIAEMAPAESRGKWQSLVAAVGFCAVPVIAFICSRVVTDENTHDSWRWIFYFGGIGLVGYFIALKYLKESPRWLVSQGRLPEAEAITREITGQDIDLSEAAKSVGPRTSVMEVIGGMFTRKYIGRSLLILFTFIMITPAGFTFTVWTPKLLSKIYDSGTMLTIMTIISCGVPAGCFFASFIADKGGRKLPLAAMLLGGSVASLFFAHNAETFAMAATAGFLLSVFNMAGSFILFSYTAESYPTRMRNTATGLHNGLARLSVSGFQPILLIILAASGGVSAGYPVLANLLGGVGALGSIPAVFTTCAILLILPVPLILFFGQRTGGKSLEDIS